MTFEVPLSLPLTELLITYLLTSPSTSPPSSFAYPTSTLSLSLPGH